MKRNADYEWSLGKMVKPTVLDEGLEMIRENVKARVLHDSPLTYCGSAKSGTTDQARAQLPSCLQRWWLVMAFTNEKIRVSMGLIALTHYRNLISGLFDHSNEAAGWAKWHNSILEVVFTKADAWLPHHTNTISHHLIRVLGNHI